MGVITPPPQFWVWVVQVRTAGLRLVTLGWVSGRELRSAMCQVSAFPLYYWHSSPHTGVF